MRVAIVGLALLLAGCQTQEVSEMSYSQYKDLAVQKNKECQAQGVKPATNEMKACVSHELNREQAVRANHNARLQAAANSSTYCQGYGNSVVCF